MVKNKIKIKKNKTNGAENRTATFLEKIGMPFRSTHDILNAVVETCVSRNFVSNNNHAKEKGI